MYDAALDPTFLRNSPGDGEQADWFKLRSQENRLSKIQKIEKGIAQRRGGAEV